MGKYKAAEAEIIKKKLFELWHENRKLDFVYQKLSEQFNPFSKCVHII